MFTWMQLNLEGEFLIFKCKFLRPDFKICCFLSRSIGLIPLVVILFLQVCRIIEPEEILKFKNVVNVVHLLFCDFQFLFI